MDFFCLLGYEWVCVKVCEGEYCSKKISMKSFCVEIKCEVIRSFFGYEIGFFIVFLLWIFIGCVWNK